MASTRRRVMLLIVMVVSGGTTPLTAQQDPVSSRQVATVSTQLEERTRALASQIRCPVCQGLSIQDSPSQLAQQMRDRVQQMLQDGQTPDDVKRYFVARYGVWVLMEPPAAGFTWLVYVLPVLALVGGATVVTLAVRRWTVSSGTSDTLPVPAQQITKQTPTKSS